MLQLLRPALSQAQHHPSQLAAQLLGRCPHAGRLGGDGALRVGRGQVKMPQILHCYHQPEPVCGQHPPGCGAGCRAAPGPRSPAAPAAAAPPPPAPAGPRCPPPPPAAGTAHPAAAPLPNTACKAEATSSTSPSWGTEEALMLRATLSGLSLVRSPQPLCEARLRDQRQDGATSLQGGHGGSGTWGQRLWDPRDPVEPTRGA